MGHDFDTLLDSRCTGPRMSVRISKRRSGRLAASSTTLNGDSVTQFSPNVTGTYLRTGLDGRVLLLVADMGENHKG